MEANYLKKKNNLEARKNSICNKDFFCEIKILNYNFLHNIEYQIFCCNISINFHVSGEFN